MAQGGIIHGIRPDPYCVLYVFYLFCCIICSYSCCPLLRHRLRRLTLATRSSSRTTTRPSHAGRGAGRRVSTRRSRRSPSCSRCANVFKHTFIRAPRSASAVAHTPDVEWSSGTRMLYQVLYVYRRQYRQYMYEHLCVLNIIHILLL